MNRKQRRTEKAVKKTGADPGVAALFAAALQQHQAGRLAEAEALYRQVLAADGRHADSLHYLGVLATQVQRPDAAADLIHQAIAIRGDVPVFYSSLGNAYQALGRRDDAVAQYKCALMLDPESFEALNNMGVILMTQGKTAEATACYERVLARKPDSAETHNNLGNALFKQTRLAEAETHFRQALTLKPDYVQAHYNLANALKAQNKMDDAVVFYQQALALKPDYADAINNLAMALIAQGKFVDSENCYRRLLALQPDNPEIINRLGGTLLYQQKTEDAIDCFKRAHDLAPNNADVLNNLGSAFKEQGQLDDAITYFKKAVVLQPGDGLKHSNLLLTMVYAASVSPDELAATARAFGATLADPLRRPHPFPHDLSAERKLKIGYVSPDFREHAVNYFFEPLLTLRDRARFEVFAYSNTSPEDAITARLKPQFDHWRDIRFLSDDQAADLVEADGIDVLIDLAGHTANNRLLVFARKPAPVQLTWLGFPGTTGMAAMDYRITDAYAEPPGLTEHLNTETLWRLPEIFCCYHPHEKSPAVINHSPFEDNGHITFGCFNNFAKVTDAVLETWAKIMAQTPGAKLLLEIAGLDGPRFRQTVESRLRRAGLAPDRVMLEPRRRANQFVLYNRIDIALDPFPAAGGTTTMDTLWMGVPLVTLAGDHFVSRMGVSIVTNAGMPELVAKNTDDYIRIARDLALDRERLKKLRHDLRDRVAASPLMNQAAFTRHMEAAYRGMWLAYVEKNSPPA